MENNLSNFIQKNSPDGGFLQSDEWRKFQESVGRKTFNVSTLTQPSPYEGGGVIGFWANIIEHSLPIVGKYFYVPRGPILEKNPNDKFQITNKFQNQNDRISKPVRGLINLAKKNKAGWVRVEPNDEEMLEIIRAAVGVRFIEPGTVGFNKLNRYKTKYKIAKAPHDMQPKEIFVIDIAKSEEQLLAEMKPKTRYNIKLAEKRSVKSLRITNSYECTNYEKYVNEFLRLVKITAERDGITPHPESYYRKMIEVISGDVLRLYVAEHQGKIIAANLVVFYGDTCTYLHGASDNENRNVMAPYLLQWKQIQDAKAAGCKKYDFGGINTKTGEGITRFKLGFSPNTEPTKFPGCYDVIINPMSYWLYRVIQKAKGMARK